jgi:hypothetical protein
MYSGTDFSECGLQLLRANERIQQMEIRHAEVFSIECVLYRICSLKNVFSIERIQQMDIRHAEVFTIECVLYRMCSL